MRTLSLLVLLSLTACKEKPKDTPATGSAATTSSGSAAVPDAAAPVHAAAAAEPGCKGWHAAKVEHMGMGQSSVWSEGAAGTYAVTSTREEPHGGVETSNGTITRETWDQMWRALDAAGWDRLVSPCLTVNPPPDSVGITELELSISNGRT